MVELLVALVIGLFLSAAIIEVFSANKQTNRLIGISAKRHEDIRFAIDFLTGALRSAGFVGCNSDAGLQIHLLTGGGTDPLLAGVCTAGKCYSSDMIDIQTVTAAGGPRPYGIGDSSIRMPIGSAAIGFYRSNTANCGAQTATSLTQASSGVALSRACNFGVDPYILVATCSGISVVQANGDTSGDTALALKSGSSFADLPYNYPQGADVYKLTGSMFYVACRTGDDSDCGLFYDDDIDDGGNPQELVQGVADMRAQYGVDTDTSADGSADIFVGDPSALTIAGVDNPWHRVVSLRLALLMVSHEDNLVAGDPEAYVFPPWDANTATIPTDRRVRKVYTTSVALRNRIANLRNNL